MHIKTSARRECGGFKPIAAHQPLFDMKSLDYCVGFRAHRAQRLLLLAPLCQRVDERVLACAGRRRRPRPVHKGAPLPTC